MFWEQSADAKHLKPQIFTSEETAGWTEEDYNGLELVRCLQTRLGTGDFECLDENCPSDEVRAAGGIFSHDSIYNRVVRLVESADGGKCFYDDGETYLYSHNFDGIQVVLAGGPVPGVFYRTADRDRFLTAFLQLDSSEV